MPRMPCRTLPAPDLAAALGGRCIQPDLIVIEQVVDGSTWDVLPHDRHTYLRLVYGVGPWWEASLQEKGYRTLHDLVAHARFGPDAATCLECLVRRDPRALKARGAPVDRPVRLFALGELAFLDIETIDVPFLRAAMQFHDVDTGRLDGLFNADLMYPMRRRYREELPDCRLTTVAAEVLGMRRLDDIPGELIPIEYGCFLKSRDPAVLRRILDHNRDNLLALREIAKHAVAVGCVDGGTT